MGKVQKFQFKSKKKEAKFFVFSSMATLLAACEFEATENADDINLGEVDKAGILDALAGNDKVTGSQYGDLIRGNKGADVIKSGQGEDHLVVVGLSKDGKYNLTDITNANGTNNDISGVVSLAEINNNSTSEIVKGDVMDGGNDGAIIFIFGDVDLSVATLLNIKKIELQGDLKFGAEQLDALAADGEFKGINGDQNSTLTIEADGKNVEVDLTKMDLSNIKTLVLKGDVTLLVDQEDLKDIKSIEGEGTLKGAAGNLDFNGISLGQDIKVEAAGDLKIISTGGAEAFSQGEKLLYTGEISDIDGTDGVQFTHNWIRSDNADGTGNVTNLGSAKEYGITTADVGKYISLQTTYTDNKGNSETIITKNGKLITNINDAPTSGTLTIVSSGGANFNEKDVLSLTGEISDADGTNGVTFTHVWIKSDNADGTGNVVELGSNPTYTLTQADVGKYISVKTSYTDNGATQEEIVTPSNKQVANVNENPLSTIMVTSTGGADAFKQGQTLSFNGDITDLDGLTGVTISHKWIRSDNSDGTGNVVDLSTDPTYVLTQADVGKYVSLVSEYTDEQGTAETVISRSGTATINVNDDPNSTLQIASTGGVDAYREGQTLSFTGGITDADGLNGVTISHKWVRSDNDDGTGNVTDLSTDATYVLTQADVGKYVSLVSEYQDEEGTNETVLTTTNNVTTNLNANPISTIMIASTGGADAFKQGQTLSYNGSITDADGLNGVTISHKWIRSDNSDGTGNVTDIGTNATYVLTQADVGKYVSLVSEYTDEGGVAETVLTRSGTATINVNDDPNSTIQIQSTGGANAFNEGQTLSFTGAITDDDGLNGVTISHKWIRSDNSDGTGNVVDLSTDPTYVLAQADVGKYVSLVSEYTDEQGTAETVISRSSTATINVNDAPVGALSHSSSGAPNFAYKVGQTLTVNDTITDADGISSGKTYHWYRSDDSGRTTNIDKIGTGTTYVLQEADQFKYISVRVSYEDDEQTKENVLALSNQSIGDQFISFTTGATNEALTGTDGDDIFRADTLSNQAGESADGGLGTDTLKLIGTLGGVMPNISNIEKIHLFAPDASSTEDFRGNADITHVKVEALQGDFTLQVQDDVSVSVERPSGNGTLNIEYTGVATQVEIDLSDMNKTTNLDIQDLDGNSIDTVILNTSNSGTNLQNVTGTDLAANATLQITGDQDLEINGNITGFAQINASTHTGKLTITHDNIIGGSGSDELNGTVGVDFINAGDGDNKVDAGAGADEITLGNGDNTIIIHNDDTASVTVPVGNSISTVGMDIITGANSGDIIHQQTNTSLLFGGKPVFTVQEAFVGDTAVLVRGNYDSAANTFVGDANGSDSMIVRDENQDNGIGDFGAFVLVGFTGGLVAEMGDPANPAQYTGHYLGLSEDVDFYMTGAGHNGSTGIDNYTGTAGDDLIIADNLTPWYSPNENALGTDVIDGAGGEDTIVFSGVVAGNTPSLTNVEHVKIFYGFPNNDANFIDFRDVAFDDIQTITVEQRHSDYIQKHRDDVSVKLVKEGNTSDRNVTKLDYTGTAQNIELIVDDLAQNSASLSAKIEITDGGGDSITNLNLKTEGSESFLNIIDVSNANLLNQFTISGDQNLTIDDKLADQVTNIDASTMTADLNIKLGDNGVTYDGSLGSDTVTGGAGADTLSGGAGEDVLIGGTGVDTFQFKSGDSALSLTGSGNNGTLAGFDEITDYTFDGANSDIYEIEGQNSIAAAATDVDGVNSTLTIHGESVDSHSISNGMLSVKLEFNTTNEPIQGDDVDAIVQYLQLQDLGDAGTSVAFNAGADAYVFTQGDDLGTDAQDILTKLTNIQLNALEDVNSQTANTLFIA